MTTTSNWTGAQQTHLEYNFFRALHEFTTKSLVSWEFATNTTRDLLQAIENYQLSMTEDHCLQTLLSINDICLRNTVRFQLTRDAVENLSHILKRIFFEPNNMFTFFRGVNFHTIYHECVDYLKGFFPALIWIETSKPDYYQSEWIFGTFAYTNNDHRSNDRQIYRFQTVKHDTTVERAIQMIHSSGKISVRGDLNEIFRGPHLSWWAADLSTDNGVQCPSFRKDESRYGAVRFIVPLKTLLLYARQENVDALHFYALGTRQYRRERCHSLMISRKNRQSFIGYDIDYKEQNCNERHELIRHLMSTDQDCEWVCYYRSDELYDQLNFAIELGDESMDFSPNSGFRIEFVNHLAYCNRLRRPLSDQDSCRAYANKAKRDFVEQLKRANTSLVTLQGFFEEETFSELLDLYNRSDEQI